MKKMILALLITLATTCFIYSQTQALMVDANGNVGIGTSSPEVKLHVDGDIKGDDITATRVTAETMSGKINSSQLDYIYAGNQVIVSHWEGTLTPNAESAVIGVGGNDSLLGLPQIPNPDPANYKLLYYFTAVAGNKDMYFTQLRINDIPIFLLYTWAGPDYLKYIVNIKSKFFTSWLDFPTKVVWGESSVGLKITVKGNPDGTSMSFFNNLAVNYIYVRKTITIDYLLPPHQ